MPTDLAGWFALAGGVVGILAIVASVVAYLRVGLAQATIKTLNESNTAYKERNEQLDTTIARLEAQYNSLNAKYEAIERENRTLRELVSGKADVQAIFEVIRKHHEEVMSDRSSFKDMWVAGQLEIHARLEANHKALHDVLAVVGSGREALDG